MRKIIVAVMVLALVVSFSGCCINVEENLTSYTATFTMYICSDSNQSVSTGISSTDLATSQRLIDTYAQIMKSNRLLDQVAEEPGISLTASQIREMLSIEAVKDTSVLKITVTSNDSQKVLEIAQAIARIAPDVMSNVIEGSSFRIVDNPEVTEEISLRNLFR